MGIVGGALKLGSSLLNPKATVHDVKRLGKEELAEGIESIKEEIQQSAKEISNDMKIIELGLSDMKCIVRKTYTVVVDSRYKDGIEGINAAYRNYVMGSHNLEQALDSLQYYMFELETNALKSMDVDKISEYLTILKETGELKVLEDVFRYIIVTKAKCLQMSCVYYIFKQDSCRVTLEFERFNNDFHELHKIYKNIVGSDFDAGKRRKGMY